MKILITSGGTREYIDDVRVLTNISSGKLGAMIAEKFIKTERINKTGYHKRSMIYKTPLDITYICSKGSETPNHSIYDKVTLCEVTDVKSVYDTMERLVPEMDVIIHCMAVSDFGFEPCSTKLKSNDPEAFIDSLRDRIYQTPKILSMIKKWNPNCKLISFKFEVGLLHDDLIKIATESGLKNDCDLVIANDKKEMIDNHSHIAYAININNDKISRLSDKEDISKFIFNYING